MISLFRLRPLLSTSTRVRQSSTSTDKSPLFILRQRTGLAYSLCRQALTKHNNNVNEAESWLKEQALIHGHQTATKVQGRSTKEGLICIAASECNKTASVIEINCETDFVAKNQLFRDFSLYLTNDIVASITHPKVPAVHPSDSLITSRLDEDSLKIYNDRIVPFISKLGENIRLASVTHFKVPQSSIDVRLFGQIHAKAAEKVSQNYNITSGRFGAVVAVKSQDKGNEQCNINLSSVGTRLCRHVIGYNPKYIELPEDIRNKLLKEEVEIKTMKDNKTRDRDSSDYDTDTEELSTKNNPRDDWPSIMDQTLILSEDLTVRDFCKENSISIVHFQRFECGQ